MLKKYDRMAKCNRCRFRNKTRREWCFFYDRRISQIENVCKIDPDNITQHQLDRFRRKINRVSK